MWRSFHFFFTWDINFVWDKSYWNNEHFQVCNADHYSPPPQKSQRMTQRNISYIHQDTSVCQDEMYGQEQVETQREFEGSEEIHRHNGQPRRFHKDSPVDGCWCMIAKSINNRNTREVFFNKVHGYLNGNQVCGMVLGPDIMWRKVPCYVTATIHNLL